MVRGLILLVMASAKIQCPCKLNSDYHWKRLRVTKTSPQGVVESEECVAVPQSTHKKLVRVVSVAAKESLLVDPSSKLQYISADVACRNHSSSQEADGKSSQFDNYMMEDSEVDDEEESDTALGNDDDNISDSSHDKSVRALSYPINKNANYSDKLPDVRALSNFHGWSLV